MHNISINKKFLINFIYFKFFFFCSKKLDTIIFDLSYIGTMFPLLFGIIPLPTRNHAVTPTLSNVKLSISIVLVFSI